MTDMKRTILTIVIAAVSTAAFAQTEIPEGDLWFFSGQSNMELPISRCMDVVAPYVADYTCEDIHYLKVPLSYNFDWPQKAVPAGRWETLSTPATAQGWGALCYFVARGLHEADGRQVTVINSSVGGSPIEAWLPAEELPGWAQDQLRQCRDPKWMESTLYHNAHLYVDWQNEHDALPENTASQWVKLDDMFSDWGLEDGHAVYGSHYLRNEFKLKASQCRGDAILHLGAMRDADSTFVNGHYVGNTTYMYPPRNYRVPAEYLHPGINVVDIHLYAAESGAAFVPDKEYSLEPSSGRAVRLTEGWQYRRGKRMHRRDNQVFLQYMASGLYNAMVAPYAEAGIGSRLKGVVWYQGESNAGRPDDYGELLKKMITSWRKAFNRPDLPFYIVELAAFEHSERETAQTSGWVKVQDLQRQVAEEMDNVYVICNRDLGEWNDIHPQDKKTLGERAVQVILESEARPEMAVPVTSCDNPLTYSDIPDIDVVRKGDDYYMVSTTMFYHPMVPIMHSRDLVHWEIVSYVCDDICEGNPDAEEIYSFKGSRSAYGKGQWATSLRYHDGWWYALFITNETGKTYVYRTDDINRSGWERVGTYDSFFHDASLFFEDGRVWAIFGNTQLYIAELESDLSGVKVEPKLLIDTPREGLMLGAEGTRFYHIGDWYYLLEIDWPMGGVRTERCWRSRSLEGPWESRVICSGTIGGRGDGIAQGCLIDTPSGDWYAMLFQDHGAVGRIPTLQKVEWVDGWPLINGDTRPADHIDVNLAPSGSNRVWASDDFGCETLDLVWQWNHKPLDGCWSLTERPGWLTLTTGQIATGLSDARNTLTQRTVGPTCESSVRLDASGLLEGDFAGISAFQSNRASIGVVRRADGFYIELLEERPLRRDETGFPGNASSVIFSSRTDSAGDVLLKIRYDFNRDTATFSFSEDGSSWTDIDYQLHMRFTLDYFTGYRTALFCYPTVQTGGKACFDWFVQK